ncbi:MAG TPA: LuxR C-terminal-related transcriptional regulator [Solirubrobacteraceae bacterium]|nr:LuxR C-terminal-related transcriptional regulator [Solirubrobacteraceae bacterium]
MDELDALLAGVDVVALLAQQPLTVALGLAGGDAPDRFLVGLATLTLLAATAEEQPLLCLVDDLQWLDSATGQALSFVARRLLAEPVAIVFTVREPSDERHAAGLPELRLEGLGHDDASALLATVVPGRLDEHVRDRIIAETRGNPLALLELPRGMSAAELAGGFFAATPSDIEQGLRQLRLDPLPAETRRLLQIAAADPVGEPLLVWRAAEHLGIRADAAAPAVEAGLLEIGAQVRFLHPCMRAAAYGSATPDERQDVHAALARATDPELDPDRRAWHLAQATAGPDEQVAGELERSADRALARGGLAAAAAFLDSAATLTPDPARRATRLLAAARAKRDAGALDAALVLLAAVNAGPVDAQQSAEVEKLRGEIAFDQRRVGEAAQLLVSAARQLESLDAQLARTTHLEALGAAMWAGHGRLAEAADAARQAPAGPEPPGAVDLLLDAFAICVTEGYRAATPALREAVDAVLALQPDGDIGRWLWLTGLRGGAIAALELWDADAWHVLAERQVQVAREMGALVRLQFALQFLARSHVLGGDLAAAGRAIEEDRAIAEATGTLPVAYTEVTLAAWRGQEALTFELIERRTAEASARGIGRLMQIASYSTAVLSNAIGRYDAALDAARQAFDPDDLGFSPFVVPEVAEAASRTGDAALLDTTATWLAERTAASPCDWALGMEARVRALATAGEAAEPLYLESIERLGRTRLRLEVARGRLLYGEWLRRESRRVDAREQLRVAREAFLATGAEAFAERARRELLATGEKVRKRRDDTRDELTPQEEHIARLARDGRTNPEIGAELFLSPRTVEWHLKKVFTKLGISSRRALRDALPAQEREAAAV